MLCPGDGAGPGDGGGCGDGDGGGNSHSPPEQIKPVSHLFFLHLPPNLPGLGVGGDGLGDGLGVGGDGLGDGVFNNLLVPSNTRATNKDKLQA